MCDGGLVSVPVETRAAPGCRGDLEAVRHLARSGLDVYAHNIETVDRQVAVTSFIDREVCSELFNPPKQAAASCPRPPCWLPADARCIEVGAFCCLEVPQTGENPGYTHVLSVNSSRGMSFHRTAKAEGVYTKSSIMLGLGETDGEIIDTMLDLKV